MFNVEASKQFAKEYKLCLKRNLNISLIDSIIIKIAKEQVLPAKHKPHKLTGNYTGCWECHITPDWLLVWQYDYISNTIYLLRTGSHSDLF